MKVWVVTSHDGWGEGHSVDGVYATLPAAQEGVKAAHPGIVFSGETRACRVADDDPGCEEAPFVDIGELEVRDLVIAAQERENAEGAPG